MTSARVLTFARDDMLVRDAVDGFLGSLASAGTKEKYRQWLGAVISTLPGGYTAPLSTWTTETLSVAFQAVHGGLAPRTVNARIAAVRSFLGYARRHGWPVGAVELVADRRAVKRDPTKSIPAPALDRLWERRDIPVREKTLWLILYASAARSVEILNADVHGGCLDQSNNRIRIIQKGDTPRWAVYQAPAARLLPRLLRVDGPDGPITRTRGPLFLADRAAPDGARRPALADVCPHTGRGRLSYRRAATLFTNITGGWTLHQLRHSRITHLLEAGYSLAEVMAVTGHTSLRSLEWYGKLGYETAARIAAETDPARRRR